MRSSTLTRGAALAVIAALTAACADAPTAPEGPGPLLNHVGGANSTPVAELLKVCKVGPDASFTVSYSTAPFNDFGITAFDLADGECMHIATASSPVTATIVETPGAGSHLVSISVAYAGDNVTAEDLDVATKTAVVTFGEDPTGPGVGAAPSGATVTFTNRLDVVVGGEGCTPGYWKQPHHWDSWTAPYTPATEFDDVFADAFGEMTLQEVLSQGGGGLKALGRHAVAALLNAASPGVDYDMTTAEVIAAFNAAYLSGDYEALKTTLEDFNEQGCPLN